jgi:spermidine/putrescine transport system substrate-binding protein
MSDSRRQGPDPISRREFLRRAGMAGIALPSAAAILAACSSGGSSGTSGTPTALPLARPDNPVTLPTADNPMIKDGLQPESGPLKIFGYNDYIYKKVRNAFAEKFNTDVQYTVFDTPDEMVEKLHSGSVDADVIVSVTVDNLGKLAAGKLIQPLNHSYLTNFSNVWNVLQSPFYDVNSQFSVPYTVYTTGIAYRNDIVKTDVAAMANPYDIHWDTKYAGRSHLLNGSRDPIAMALLHAGFDDVNTGDTTQLDTAKQDLLDGVDKVNWKFDHVDYTEITSGASWAVHQTWSGQAAYYQYYLPKGLDISAFTYVWPPKADAKFPGMISNDMLSIPRVAKSPVLAHEMINFLLDAKNAETNYSYEGYQPPLNSIEPDAIVAKGLIPPSQKNIIITEEDFPLGVSELELTPAVTQQWQQIYQEVTGGA